MAEQVFTQYTAAQTYDDYTSVDGVSTFGGQDDLFGLDELTVEQLQSTEFAVSFDADLDGSTVFVDDITVEVFFELPLGNYNPDGLPPKSLSPFSSSAIGKNVDGVTRIVVVGTGGIIRYSDDLGASWADATSNAASTLWGVSATADGFIAVGEMGTLLYSEDGATWAPQDAQTRDHLFSVVGTKRALVSVAVGKGSAKRRRYNGSDEWEIRA